MYGQPSRRKSPMSSNKSQEPTCSHIQEFHNPTKLIAIIYTWRTWYIDPCRSCACCLGLCELIRSLLCWFRVLCSLVIFPSPLSLIICLPSLSKSSAGFDEHLQFRFSFCIMPACQSLNLFPSAAKGYLSDDDSLKHWSMHIEKYH